MAREVGFLTVHGVLHLLGWDHEESEDERRMMGKTEDILAAIGLTREA
jgi:probable rRNA maturation factor